MLSIIHLSLMFFSNMMESILLMNKLLSTIMTFDNRIMVNLSHMSDQFSISFGSKMINFTKKFCTVKKNQYHNSNFQVIKLSCISINSKTDSFYSMVIQLHECSRKRKFYFFLAKFIFTFFLQHRADPL
jgi:hypothetical protein